MTSNIKSLPLSRIARRVRDTTPQVSQKSKEKESLLGKLEDCLDLHNR